MVKTGNQNMSSITNGNIESQIDKNKTKNRPIALKGEKGCEKVKEE